MQSPRAPIIAELKKAFGDLAGQDLQGADEAVEFLDLGFDSLFLTQTTAALKVRFGVKVTFRQLNEDLCSFNALADYLLKPDTARGSAKRPRWRCVYSLDLGVFAA